MINLFHARLCRRSVTALLLALTGACGSLQQTTPPPSFYSLDRAPSEARATTRAAPRTGLTLIINPPHAAAGFDSQRIIYVR